MTAKQIIEAVGRGRGSKIGTIILRAIDRYVKHEKWWYDGSVTRDQTTLTRLKPEFAKEITDFFSQLYRAAEFDWELRASSWSFSGSAAHLAVTSARERATQLSHDKGMALLKRMDFEAYTDHCIANGQDIDYL